MKRLLLSFIISILTAGTAQAVSTESKTDHAVKLIKTFEANKVDEVINSSVSTMICNEGVNSQVDNDLQVDQSGGRAPGFISGKGKFQIFKEEVEKGHFRESYYKEGDVYSYSSKKKKPFLIDGIEFEKSESEFVFDRKSQVEDHSFEHEFGLTKADVKKGILKLLQEADEHYQTDEKAFIVRIKEKAYFIDMNRPLMANPVYKEDVNTGNFDYGLTNVTPRKDDQIPFVSLSE